MKADQVGALCVRRRANGSCQVLLVTSRDTGRWIIPNGWKAKRLKDHEAAAREADEEAGVSGKVTSVFLLQVRRERDHWPERHQRRRAWFDVREAVKEVGEPELRTLIKGVERLAYVQRVAAAG